jgi:CheY-like chemotaxis protein
MAKILLVEDEMLVRELAFEDLTDAGHDVTAAGSGDEALAILRRDQAFDVLFTDIRMPGEIDGWQLADEARELIPTLKIIFATGLNDDAGWKRPEDRMLAKPYRKDELLHALG